MKSELKDKLTVYGLFLIILSVFYFFQAIPTLALKKPTIHMKVTATASS